jgi:hypothetical protein
MNVLYKKRLVISCAALGFASVLVHPFGAEKNRKSDNPILGGVAIDSKVLPIIGRSCQDCHSERTAWPWYSYVPPMSWLMEHDVHRGRDRMNLSRWESYSVRQKARILAEMSAVVRNRVMPLPKYLLLHPGAKLSDSDIEQINRWALKERGRLRSMPAPQANTLTTNPTSE